MSQVRTVKYLVVQDVLEHVPNGAPEIDGSIATVADLKACLLGVPGVPKSSLYYLQTVRTDGTLRWQPLEVVTDLPHSSLLVVKIVKQNLAPMFKQGTGGQRSQLHCYGKPH